MHSFIDIQRLLDKVDTAMREDIKNTQEKLRGIAHKDNALLFSIAKANTQLLTQKLDEIKDINDLLNEYILLGIGENDLDERTKKSLSNAYDIFKEFLELREGLKDRMKLQRMIQYN